MAASVVMTDRHIVSTVLHHLSDMKYRDRRQYGPNQPVEFLEFRPTLVPAILVNRLWADEGTTILWRRYPHVPALEFMPLNRKQYYASKVQRIFVTNPTGDFSEMLEYLDGLRWPNLRTLESEVDLARFGRSLRSMLHGGLNRLKLSGYQSGGPKYLADVVLPMVFVSASIPVVASSWEQF